MVLNYINVQHNVHYQQWLFVEDVKHFVILNNFYNLETKKRENVLLNVIKIFQNISYMIMKNIV